MSWSVERGAWIVAGIVASGLGAAAAWGHSGKAAVAIKAYSPLTADGTLTEWMRRLEKSNWNARLDAQKGSVAEWLGVPPTYINALTARIESGAITGPSDFAAALYTMWDAQRLYVAAVVTDDAVVTEHEGADIWQDDAVEVWLDCRHDAVTRTMLQDDEYQLGFSPAGPSRSRAVGWVWRNPNSEPVIAALSVGSVLTEHGYVVEAAVPWSVLRGCEPSVGGLIGFNVSVVDKDDDQLWTHITWSGQLHSDPSEFGHLYFMEAPEDLLASDVFEGEAKNDVTDELLGGSP